MHPFSVSRADDAAKAIAAHALDPELAFIAGGTDLIGLMKDRAVLPERLLDIIRSADLVDPWLHQLWLVVGAPARGAGPFRLSRDSA